MAKKDFKQQVCEELIYWRGRLGFPDLTPQMSLAANSKLPARPEVDPVAKKQFDVMVETLLSRAANVGHLDKIVSLLRATHKECPTPPEIHAVADLVDAESEENRARIWDGKPAVCPHGECDGTGFMRSRAGGEVQPTSVFCRCHAAYVVPKGATHAATAK